MGILDKLFKKRPGGVKMGLLCAMVGLVLVGALTFVWTPIGPEGSVYGAPCELGEKPEVDDCEIAEHDDCDPQIEQCTGATECTGDDCGLIDKYLNPTINFLAIIVGLVVTISIVVGGIQYSSAGDNPQATAKAKNRIVESLIALLAFALLYLGLEWLIPGGFF